MKNRFSESSQFTCRFRLIFVHESWALGGTGSLLAVVRLQATRENKRCQEPFIKVTHTFYEPRFRLEGGGKKTQANRTEAASATIPLPTQKYHGSSDPSTSPSAVKGNTQKNTAKNSPASTKSSRSVHSQIAAWLVTTSNNPPRG
jgi:hypothetical protein